MQIINKEKTIFKKNVSGQEHVTYIKVPTFSIYNSVTLIMLTCSHAIKSAKPIRKTSLNSQPNPYIKGEDSKNNLQTIILSSNKAFDDKILNKQISYKKFNNLINYYKKPDTHETKNE